MTEKQTYVYALYEDLSNTPFYVGITVEPRRRLNSHRAAADGRRQDTLTGCGIKGGDISMRLLAQCDDRANAETIEKALQSHYDLKSEKASKKKSVWSAPILGTVSDSNKTVAIEKKVEMISNEMSNDMSQALSAATTKRVTPAAVADKQARQMGPACVLGIKRPKTEAEAKRNAKVLTDEISKGRTIIGSTKPLSVTINKSDIDNSVCFDPKLCAINTRLKKMGALHAVVLQDSVWIVWKKNPSVVVIYKLDKLNQKFIAGFDDYAITGVFPDCGTVTLSPTVLRKREDRIREWTNRTKSGVVAPMSLLTPSNLSSFKPGTMEAYAVDVLAADLAGLPIPPGPKAGPRKRATEVDKRRPRRKYVGR